jgi:NAD(P)-dependent dehydrogenase (short-subunit alcohol dehydrogenase family)
MGGLEGKSALVVGSSSGIGRAIAVRFGREGARVALASRTTAGDEETARLVREAGGEALVVPTDIAVREDPQRAVDATVEAFGGLDCAVNNAARIGEPTLVGDGSLEDWDTTIQTNLTGTWLCMRAELAAMVAGGSGGAIVNIASAGGLVGAPMMGAYSASKAGVIGLTRTAALEYAKQRIRVNAVCPGPVETPMTIAMGERGGPTAADMAQFIPIGRVGDPDEVAAAVAFLCSDAGAFTIGVALPVDGGMVAG